MKFSHILLLFLFFTTSHLAFSQTSDINFKELIRPDFTDFEGYGRNFSFLKNRTTQTGWKIEYFVKNDSTKYEDIYISFQKNEIRKIYLCSNVLKYRTYFTPTFSQETEDYIYFEYGCATDCGGVLAFSKNNYTFDSFDRIIELDLELNLLVLMTDNASHVQTEYFEFEIIDLARKKNYLVSFDMICRGVHMQNCIKEVIFSKHEIIVKLLLSDKQWTKEIKETRTIKLE